MRSRASMSMTEDADDATLSLVLVVLAAVMTPVSTALRSLGPASVTVKVPSGVLAPMLTGLATTTLPLPVPMQHNDPSLLKETAVTLPQKGGSCGPNAASMASSETIVPVAAAVVLVEAAADFSPPTPSPLRDPPPTLLSLASPILLSDDDEEDKEEEAGLEATR